MLIPTSEPNLIIFGSGTNYLGGGGGRGGGEEEGEDRGRRFSPQQCFLIATKIIHICSRTLTSINTENNMNF